MRCQTRLKRAARQNRHCSCHFIFTAFRELPLIVCVRVVMSFAGQVKEALGSGTTKVLKRGRVACNDHLAITIMLSRRPRLEIPKGSFCGVLGRLVCGIFKRGSGSSCRRIRPVTSVRTRRMATSQGRIFSPIALVEVPTFLSGRAATGPTRGVPRHGVAPTISRYCPEKPAAVI